MPKIDHKYYYIPYIIIFILVAVCIDNKYNFTDTLQNKAAYIATVSELLGLTIALIEIFILNGVTKKIKEGINNLQAYSDISSVSIFLSQTKDDLISKKFGKAILRLEKIRDVYQENLPATELTTATSAHRANFDKINSIISTLTIADETFPRNLGQSELQEFVTFLTSFNETLTTLKLTFKNSIV